MQLLVSVGTPDEALAALEGGADLIDAKDAESGALGAVSEETLEKIQVAVAGRRPVTAALGDAFDEALIEDIAFRFARAGASFVKVGFSGIDSAERIQSLIGATSRGARSASNGTRIVAVAYADADQVSSIGAHALVRIAARSGIEGLLVDTADKSGPGLRGLLGPAALASLVDDAHRAALFVALAGKLTAADLPFMGSTGADIAGVRGAACAGGRTGTVSADRVRILRDHCATDSAAHCVPQAGS